MKTMVLTCTGQPFPSFLSWTSLPPSNRIKRLLTCASLASDLRWKSQIENIELAWQLPPDFWMKHGVLDHYEVLPFHARLHLLDGIRPSGECIQLYTCPVGNICRPVPTPKARCHFWQIGIKRLELWKENCIQKLHCRFFKEKESSSSEPVFYP